MTTTVNHQEQIKSINSLPIRTNLKAGYLASALIVVCTAIATSAGIYYADQIYPTTEAGQSFIANDVVTLFIGLPILLISMWLTHQGKLIGLLFWPGAIFYGLYNYTIYLFGAPLTIMYPLYLFILTVSIYTTIGLIAAVQAEPVRQKLTGHVSEKVSSGPLIGLGIVFGVRALVIMITAVIDQTPLPGPELGLVVADFIACTAWVIGGILLWRRQALGYVTGTGLLFSTSMLFVGVIAILLLQPIINGDPLMVVDILVLLLMGLICFVPFVLYVRGVVKS